MHDRTLFGLAVILSSVTLVALLFAFAAVRGAFWGELLALTTALGVYLFQAAQYAEVCRFEGREEPYEPSPLLERLFGLVFVVGGLSALLSIAGI